MSKWHPFGIIDPFRITKIADKILNGYWDIAESLGIQTFLYYGTCLGFIRDGGYIEADNDIDVGILGGIEELERLTVDLVKIGFVNERTIGKIVVGNTIKTVNRQFLKNDILLDVYFRFTDHKFFQSFDAVTYKGRSFNVPHPVEDYLEARYGDWKTVKHRKVWVETR